MPSFHAVVRIDHQNAEILQFGAELEKSEKIKAHSHPTAQHGSKVRTEHEFFGEVCDSLVGIAEVLVVGSQTSIADFRHYVEKHRPALVANIVDYQTVANPTSGQLLALAREAFLKIDRMRGVPTPS